MWRDNTRRQILAGIGASITAGLAGCSAFDVVSSSGEEGQTQTEGQDKTVTIKTSPQESEYVSDGQMNVGPSIQVYNIWDITPTSVSIGMQAMPNPLADYDIEVYFTPLGQLPTDWEYNKPIVNSANTSYDRETHTWVPDVPEGKKSGRFELTPRESFEAQEYGEKVASFTVPSGAAGMVSEDVNPPEGLSKDELPEYLYSSTGMNYLTTEYKDWYTQLPSVGDRYDKRLYRVNNAQNTSSGVHLVSQNQAVGTYPLDVQPVYHFPYIKDIELDKEIPKTTPGIFTFAWTEQPTVSDRAGEIVAQTGQFVRVGDEVQNPTSLGYDGIEHPTVNDKDKKPNPLHVTTQKFVLYYDVFNRPGFHTSVERDGGTNTVNHFRISHYGRHSPEMKEIARMDSTRGDDPLKYAGMIASNLIRGNVQNMWGIDYTIPEQVAQEAKREGLQMIQQASNQGQNTFTVMYEDDRVLQHQKLQEVASKLKTVCDNIGADSKAAQLRVVADFVQYLPHVSTDYDDLEPVWGDMSDVPTQYYSSISLGGTVSHPVWTLYTGLGDCEDFTVLFNAIALTDQFNIDVGAGHLEGIDQFNSGGGTVGHVSTAVPKEELGISEVITAGGDDDVQGLFVPATYEYQGDEYVYIETSTPAPIGMITRDPSWQAELPPTPVEESSTY